MAELKKVLSYKSILLITINSIMGTGIFFLPAVGAATSGPASILAWAFMCVLSIYIAMCFAELTSMFPKSGGIYEFCKQAYGRWLSFIIGWGTIIAGNITIAMLVVGAIQYLLPVQLPFVKIGLCLFFIFAFNYIAFKGMETSAFMLVTFAFITLISLLGLVIPGLFHINPGNYTPFFTFPISAILVTTFLIAETFFGWETATFLAEETKDGEKVMPKALIVGTIIICVISLLFVIIALGAIPWETFGASKAPLADLAFLFYGPWGQKAFTLLVYLAIIGSVAGWIVSAPRLILAMAKDKLFLAQFGAIHEKYSTPYKAILFQTVLTTILVIVGAGSYETLLHLLVPIVLVMYSFVILSVVVLRYKQPDTKRYFTTPFGKIGPFIIIAFLMFMIVMWVMHTGGALQILIFGGSLILLGIPIYYLLELYYDPRAIRFTNNILAYLNLATERITIPMKVRKNIIQLIGNIKGKTILEFGCSVGTMTLHLAEEVGKMGRIYATDISERSIGITKKRLRKKGHNHVRLLHDIHHAIRVHPHVPKVDIVVSISNLGYIKNARQVLRDLNHRLGLHDKICFVEYDKFFHIIPNVEWLASDARIQQMFRQSGFAIEVKRVKSILWENIYIYGRKVRKVL